MRVNEGSPIPDAKGWDAAVGGSQPGPWFNMVQQNGSMRRLSAEADKTATYLDDLQVQLSDPISSSPFETWVAQFGLPGGQDGPNDDPDGDGATNSEEWNAGTDPGNADKVFEITAIERLSGSNCVTWVYGTNTEITTPFTVWRATNLNDLVYEVILTGIPRDSSATSTAYDTNQTANAPDYRIVIDPKTEP